MFYYAVGDEMMKKKLGANERNKTSYSKEVRHWGISNSKELADSSLAGVLPAWPHRN